MRENIAIIGAGVIGLTTGIELQQRKLGNVTIYSEKTPLQTTSAKAGAVFEPYRPGNMSTGEMLNFVTIGLQRYGEIIQHNPESCTGIRSHDLYSTSTGQIDPEQVPFLPAIPDWKLLENGDVPGEYKSALLLQAVPFIDPTYALPWLSEQFLQNGGEIKAPYQKITDIDEFLEGTPEYTIFNCSGLGAKELLHDNEMHGMRGQIAVVNITPPWDFSVLGDDGYYIFPRMNETVLGGTTELDEETEETMPATIESIIEHAQLIWPDVSRDNIERTYAGIRPFRESGANISGERRKGKQHIRNIGFGGSGWTFAWGAAEKAVTILENNSF